jgi:hypothetical protein
MSRAFLKKYPPLRYWRELRPNADYHVFTHAVEGIDPFPTDELKQAWLDTLGRRLPGAPPTSTGPEIFTDIEISAVATMDNHPHLVIGQGDDTTAISRFVGNCLRAYALRYNHLTGHHGQVFLRPFDLRWLPDRAALRRGISYVHRNPRRPELIARHTSHSQYLAEDDTGIVKVQRGLNAFGGRDAYATYFERYCRQKDAEESR